MPVARRTLVLSGPSIRSSGYQAFQFVCNQTHTCQTVQLLLVVKVCLLVRFIAPKRVPIP